SGLLPYVAKNVHRVDERGLGWLIASFSLGALAASIGMVLTGGPRRPARAMVVSIAGWYALLLVFGVARSMAAGLALLAVAGLVQSVGMISLAATLLHAPPARSGAGVMGVRQLAVYGLPLGLVTSGVLIERAGYALTSTIYCLAGLLCTALIAVRWRASLWRGESIPLPSGEREK